MRRSQRVCCCKIDAASVMLCTSSIVPASRRKSSVRCDGDCFDQDLMRPAQAAAMAALGHRVRTSVVTCSTEPSPRTATWSHGTRRMAPLSSSHTARPSSCGAHGHAAVTRCGSTGGMGVRRITPPPRVRKSFQGSSARHEPVPDAWKIQALAGTQRAHSSRVNATSAARRSWPSVMEERTGDPATAPASYPHAARTACRRTSRWRQTGPRHRR